MSRRERRLRGEVTEHAEHGAHRAAVGCGEVCLRFRRRTPSGVFAEHPLDGPATFPRWTGLRREDRTAELHRAGAGKGKKVA